MSVKHAATRAAVLGALRDVIDAEYTAARADVLDGLLVARDELGVKTLDVTLPDGTKVATVTLTEPSARVEVTDRDRFTQWVRSFNPGGITDPVDPKQLVTDAIEAAHREIRQRYDADDGGGTSAAQIDRIIAEHVLAALGINPDPKPARVNVAFEKQLLGSLIHGGDGDAIDPATGVIAAGVTVTPAGQPKQFSIRFASGGRDEIAVAWRTGRLGAVAEVSQLETSESGV